MVRVPTHEQEFHANKVAEPVRPPLRIRTTYPREPAGIVNVNRRHARRTGRGGVVRPLFFSFYF